jgi:hypothetical protein
MAFPLRAANQPVIDGQLPLCLGFQQLDSIALGASVGLTVPLGTQIVLLQAEAVSIRYRADGVAPTTAIGMLITAGGEVLYPASESALAALRFIRTAPGSILNVSYYG